MDRQRRADGPPSAFKRWRSTRPFAGGVLLVLSGLEILASIKAPLPVLIHLGMQGLAGYLVPVVILVCGVLLLVNPDQRLFYSIMGAVMSLVAWVTSNIGGFVVGMLLGLVGSALAFAWTSSKVVHPTAPPAAGEDADADEHPEVPDDPATLHLLLDDSQHTKSD